MHRDESEYLSAWIWPAHREGFRFYCRINHQWYATWEEVVQVVREADLKAGIVWPWRQELLLGKE